jgi:hypothetical protein
LTSAQSQTSVDFGTNQRWLSAALKTFAVGLWLIGHPYFGWERDGIIYAGMIALNGIAPQLSADLLFEFGKQHSWSIYPWVAARVQGLAGITWTGFLIVIIGHLLLITAAHRIASALGSGMIVPVAFLAFAMGYSYYGSSHSLQPIFSWGEGLPTARVIAEGLTLWGIAFVIERRYAYSVLTLATALLIHPLMMLSGAFVLWLLTVGRLTMPAGKLFFIGCSLALCLVVFWSLPLNMQMDPIWSEISRSTQGPILYISDFRVEHHLWSAFVVSAHLLIWRTANGAVKRVSTVLVINNCIALLLSGLGEWSTNALILSLQTWRMQWLGVALLPICLVCTYQQLRDKGSHGGRNALIGVVIIWMVMSLSQELLVTISVVAGAIMVYLLSNRPTSGESGQIDTLSYHVGRGLIIMAVGAVTIWGALNWDRRSAESVAMENAFEANSAYTLGKSPGLLFWLGGPISSQWFALKLPSYLHQVAATNVSFSRELALEFARRSEVVRPLWDGSEEGCVKLQISDIGMVCVPPAGRVRSVCRSDLRLGYIALPESKHLAELKPAQLVHWRGSDIGERVVVIDCSAVRSAFE